MSTPRLLRWLTLIALLLAPLAMIGGAPAMAHDHVAAAGHCDDMGSRDETPAPAPVDCTIACAGLPAQTAAVAAHPFLPAAPGSLVPAAWLAGLQPEAATPPPRLS